MYANNSPRPRDAQKPRSHVSEVRREFLARMRAARERSYALLRQRMRAVAS